MESFDFSLLVPILAITFGIGAGVVHMVLRHRRRQQILDIYHKERIAAGHVHDVFPYDASKRFRRAPAVP